MSFVCRGAGNSVVWGCENSVYRFQRYSRSGFAGRIPQLPQANDGDRFYLSLFFVLRARYGNQFSSRLAQMRFTSFACRLCVVVLVILLFGVARIVYIDFSGILAPASPVESLSSHKQTTATDFICRFFCASREVWKSIFVPLSTNALHCVRMSFVLCAVWP